MYNDYNGRDFCGYYDFLKPGLFIGNPELIKSILVKDFEHFSDRRTFDLGKVHNPLMSVVVVGDFFCSSFIISLVFWVNFVFILLL